MTSDGCHHLWSIDISSNNRIIYDNHDLIYAYRDDEFIINLLKIMGFSEIFIKIPTPHEHRFNCENDLDKGNIMATLKWVQDPLQTDQHDP